MARRFQHGARLVNVKKEVCNLIDDEESPKAPFVTSFVADNDDETDYLSEKVCNSAGDGKGSKAHRLVTSPVADQDDEIHYLSEKVPFFDVIIAKSHVDPANSLSLPVTALSMLPRGMVLAVLWHGGKKWEVNYTGDRGRPRFVSKWKTFAVDNRLKLGDACVFELIDPNPQKLVFKVHILREDLPPEFKPLVNTRGRTADTPIVLD